MNAIGACSIVIPPYASSIHLNEIKNHCKVELSITEDDALIASQVLAGTDVVEAGTGSNARRHKVLIATTFDLSFDRFPGCRYIEVPRVPLVSVTSVLYADPSGTTQTMPNTDYVVDTVLGRIYLDYNVSWPSTRYIQNAVTVRFTAGLVAPFTAATSGVLTISGRSYSVADRVRIMNSGGALPTGLAANTDYFVIAGGKLSATSGGSAVAITGTGNGTHFIGLDLIGFEALRSAVKLLVGAWYRNREAFVIGFDHATEMPMGVDSLVMSQHA